MSIVPGRLLFTSALPADGSGDLAARARRLCGRLQGLLRRAGTPDLLHRKVFVTDPAAYAAFARPVLDAALPAVRTTEVAVSRLPDPDAALQVELVAARSDADVVRPPLERVDGGAGILVNGGRFLYAAGQVANCPDGSVAGKNDLRRQTEKAYENAGHVLRAAGFPFGSVVRETVWTCDLAAWQREGSPVRHAFYGDALPAFTLAEIRGLSHADFQVEIELVAAGPRPQERSPVAVASVVPEGAVPVAAYKMALCVERGRLLHLSGQTALGSDGRLVGSGDVRAQTRQIFRRLRRVLQAAGGDLADLVKMTTYFLRPEDFPAIAEARHEFLPGEVPPSTILVVPRLLHPGALVMVEAVAVVQPSHDRIYDPSTP